MILQVVDATRLDLFRFPETLLSTYKKCTAGRVTSKFYMGQNEDDSPGDSSSDTSEKLLQRGRGKVSIYVILVSTCIQARIFCRRFLLVTRSSHHHERFKDFSAFLDMKRYKNLAHKIGSWKCLTICRPVLPDFPRAQSTSFLLSTLNSLQGILKISSYSCT